MDRDKALETFRAFFVGVWGVEPYPWQEALLQRVLAEGWPELVALPTGSGKTAVLDLAVFLMAWDPGRFHRRVYYVVNRRLIVDQAEERARRLAEALEAPPPDGVRWVAEQLLRRAGGGPILQAVKLRGGLPLPRHPLEDPARPAVVLSTVDQAGSRLLFRGYGLSPRAWPVEAGLAAIDSLFILDEAHLEQPFWDLLGLLQDLVGPAGERLGRPTLRRVALTATPETLGTGRNGSGGGVFTYTERDLRDPRLARIWGLSKPLERKEAKRGKLEAELAEEARRLHRELGGPVAVFCNRVDLARKVFERLRKGARALLLTGRIRPFDRDRLLGQDLQDRMDRGEVDFVVATQTLEVGADLDFKAMVSELSPLTALFQRLGRLGRRGKGGEVRGVVVYDPTAPEHPYQKAELQAAWNWLSRVERMDAGVRSLREILDEDPPPAEAWGSRVEAAPYTEDLLRLFALTDPWVEGLEPEPFLHGLRPVSPEVGLVFRADLPKTPGGQAPPADLVPPPHAYEALAVPLWAARAFLEGRAEAAGVSDLDEGEGARRQGRAVPRVAFRWTEEGLEPVRPEDLLPGDTLLLPASSGGLDAFGWNPAHTAPVRDVAEARPPEARPPHLVRLHPDVLRDALKDPSGLDEGAFRAVPGLLGAYFRALEREDLERLEEARGELAEALAALGAGLEGLEAGPAEEEALGRRFLEAFLRWLCERVEPAWAPALGHALRNLDRARVLAPEGYPGLVLRFRGEDPSIGGARPVTLREHQEEVGVVLAGFLDRLGLPDDLRRSLREAARRHDEGKLDPRMQRWLRWTMPADARVDPDEPLAKSGTRLGPREVERLRGQAGYTKGQRHELQGAAALRRVLDPLAVHLIGTHHGYARPLPRGVRDVDLAFKLSDGTPARTRHGLDLLRSGWAHDHFYLQDRYTPWGLAYLEALLRLADQAASADEPGAPEAEGEPCSG